MNKVQELQLELIGFVIRPFDGSVIAQDLTACQALWSSVMTYDTTIKGLIDMQAGEWRADTLFILPVPGQETALMSLAAGWKPDGIQWIGHGDPNDLLENWNLEQMGLLRGILMLFWRRQGSRNE